MRDLPSPLVAPISAGIPLTGPARPVAPAEHRRGIGAAVFVLAIVTAGALVHVAVRIKSIEVAYALGRERHVATELEEQRRRLQIEIGMLKDPGRVVSIARDKLRMGPPGPDVIRALGDSRHLTDIAEVAPPGLPSRGTGATRPRTPAPREGTR